MKTPSRRVIAFLTIFFLIAALWLVMALSARNERAGLIARSRLLMGTTVEIKVPVIDDRDSAFMEEAIDEAFAEMEKAEAAFSAFRADSLVARINLLKPGERLELNDEAFTLIDRALRYSQKTNGAFDITVKPLADLWKAALKEDGLPAPEEIDRALSSTGWQHVLLDPQKKTIGLSKEGVKIDLGGIAQGFAADQAIRALRGKGITDALVNAGGEIYCLGRRSPTVLWTVAVRHPRKNGGELLTVDLEDKGIDTSGDYEKYYIVGGKRYSHIIDPRSGRPAGDSIVSASVIAPDATEADALATALCVMGEDGLRAIESLGDEAVIVLKKGSAFRILTTNGFEAKYGNIAKKGFQTQ